MKKVLIVEDDMGTLELYRFQLSTAPVECVFARSSRTALDEFRKHEFDLIVADLILEGSPLTGIGIAQEVRKLGYEGLIAVLTGRDEEIGLPANLLKISAEWKKPNDAMRLRALILGLLGIEDVEEELKVEGFKDRRSRISKIEGVEWRMRAPQVIYILLFIVIIQSSLSVFQLWRSIKITTMIREIHHSVIIKK